MDGVAQTIWNFPSFNWIDPQNKRSLIEFWGKLSSCLWVPVDRHYFNYTVISERGRVLVVGWGRQDRAPLYSGLDSNFSEVNPTPGPTPSGNVYWTSTLCPSPHRASSLLEGQELWPLTNDVALGKLHTLAKPQCPWLWNKTMMAPVTWGWYKDEMWWGRCCPTVTAGRLCKCSAIPERKQLWTHRWQRMRKSLLWSLPCPLFTVASFSPSPPVPLSLSPFLSWPCTLRLTSFSLSPPFLQPSLLLTYLTVNSTGCCTVYTTEPKGPGHQGNDLWGGNL